MFPLAMLRVTYTEKRAATTNVWPRPTYHQRHCHPKQHPHQYHPHSEPPSWKQPEQQKRFPKHSADNGCRGGGGGEPVAQCQNTAEK